jgi:hypothetical protein
VGLCWIRQPGPGFAQVDDGLTSRLGRDGVEDALIERINEILNLHLASSLFEVARASSTRRCDEHFHDRPMMQLGLAPL